MRADEVKRLAAYLPHIGDGVAADKKGKEVHKKWVFALERAQWKQILQPVVECWQDGGILINMPVRVTQSNPLGLTRFLPYVIPLGDNPQLCKFTGTLDSYRTKHACWCCWVAKGQAAVFGVTRSCSCPQHAH
jgi:hypothetical protein